MTSSRLTFPCGFALDSVIDAEDVSAISSFFVDIAACRHIYFTTWDGIEMVRPEGWLKYSDRWQGIFKEVSLGHSVCLNNPVTRNERNTTRRAETANKLIKV